MPHDHILVDDDSRFVIDASTRQVTNVSGKRPKLMQFDHNCEKFVFEMPRYIEGHDMSEVDLLEVEYTNSTTGTSKTTRRINEGVDKLTDSISVSDDGNLITFDWVITDASTQLAGTLIFQFKFTCPKDLENGNPGFKWQTDKYSFVDVFASLNVRENLATLYPDLVQQLEAKTEDLDERLTQVEANLGKPAVASTPEDMDAILANATEGDVGRMYLYTGETNESYTNGAVYSIQEEEG